MPNNTMCPACHQPTGRSDGERKGDDLPAGLESVTQMACQHCGHEWEQVLRYQVLRTMRDWMGYGNAPR